MIVQTISEHIRRKSVESCFELAAFRTCWPIWKMEIQHILGSSIDENGIFNLGDHLSDIFLSTRSSGRSQDSLSGGGYGWEGLVSWYLNLVFSGTRAVAIRKVSDLPKPLRDSISVNYGNFNSNTESDITVIVFPDQQEFLLDKNSLTVTRSDGTRIANTIRSKYNYKQISDRLAEIYFERFELGIIQCKTNWNDNAQIPMLWSMIYETDSFSNSQISLGRDGYSMRDLSKFTYSFMTVPTNDLSTYNQNSTSVNRVRNLTGGNYWGNLTRSSVCSSIKEIFNNNFRTAFSTNARRNIATILPDLSSDLDYFDLT